MGKTLSVDDFIAALTHARVQEIKALRHAILQSDPGITERIKWNAPSFCWRGDDRVTMRLQPGDRLQLVFHRGARPRDATGFAFDDPSGLIAWATADRGVIDVACLEDQQGAILRAVRAWMRATATAD